MGSEKGVLVGEMSDPYLLSLDCMHYNMQQAQ